MKSWKWMQVSVTVMTKKEFFQNQEEPKLWWSEESLGRNYCRMNLDGTIMRFYMIIPDRFEKKGCHYSILIKENHFFMISEEPSFESLVVQWMDHREPEWKQMQENRSALSLLLECWFLTMLKDDLGYLQALEVQISKTEEQVLQGNCPQFNSRILPIKKLLARFSHYYNQLLEIGQELSGEKVPFFSKEDYAWVESFKERCDLLAQETQINRDYLMQIQEVYQSEIEIRQNNVMKALTMVTTICFPLSLIAAWYGMNFKHMPEIYSVYGYPVVIIVCILIVSILLLIFKKMKFW